MFEVISTPNCMFCVRAKQALRERNLSYRESHLDTPEKKRAFQEAGFRTVPQVYRDNVLIGGYTELLDWLRENIDSAS